MDNPIDVLIDSIDYIDEALIDLLDEGHKPGALTLLKYLSKGFVSGCALLFSPKPSIVQALLSAGAPPFYYRSIELPADEVIANLPKALHSTINIAALLGEVEIVKLLLRAGELPNDHTVFYAVDCRIKEILPCKTVDQFFAK